MRPGSTVISSVAKWAVVHAGKRKGQRATAYRGSGARNDACYPGGMAELKLPKSTL